MIDGVVVGLVIDNADPQKMHRIKVKYPVDGDDINTTWCRMLTPMAGKDRGLVMLPEIGTEVVLAFAYRSLTPYVLGAVYNGAADPDPYANKDGDNNLRLVWTRGDNQVVFDDTSGAETLGIGAKASAVGDVTSAPVYQRLDAANSTWKEHSDQDIQWEAGNAISIKCATFKLEASGSVSAQGGTSAVAAASSSGTINAPLINGTAAMVHLNGGAPGSPGSTMSTPSHAHPPTR